MLHDLFMRFPGGLAKALTFSYDDGVEQDKRLISVLDRHGLKATFNLNSGLFPPDDLPNPCDTLIRRMKRTEALLTYADTGHEVGLHGLTHAYLDQLPPERLTYELLEDRRRLEALFHTLVRGGAYAYGVVTPEATEALRACGIAYFRTVESTRSLELPTDWLRLAPTCHHADPMLPELCKRFLDNAPTRRPYLLYIWGHSYEFERDGNWPLIENTMATLGGHMDMYYATNLQIVDYVQAFKSLRLSCDGRRVQNPSAMDVWYTCGGEIARVCAGETAEVAGYQG